MKALTAPPGAEGSKWVPIATIELVTDLYTSKFGDERLFFQHAKTNGDRAFWPEDWMRPDRQNDPQTPQTKENIWGTFVPKNVWPVD